MPEVNSDIQALRMQMQGIAGELAQIPDMPDWVTIFPQFAVQDLTVAENDDSLHNIDFAQHRITSLGRELVRRHSRHGAPPAAYGYGCDAIAIQLSEIKKELHGVQ